MSWLSRLFTKTPLKRQLDDAETNPHGKKARVLFGQKDPVTKRLLDEENVVFVGSKDTDKLGSLLSSSLVPRPFALVATFDKKGNLNITPSSFCSLVSEKPAYVSVGLSKELPPEEPADPATNIAKTKEFTVNIVSQSIAQAAAATVGTYELPGGDVEADLKTGITTSTSNQVSVPRISEAAVTLECVMRHRYSVKHSNGEVASIVVIAEVVGLVVNEEVLTQGSGSSVDHLRLKPVAALGPSLYGTVGGAYNLEVPAQPAEPSNTSDQPPAASEQEKIAEVVGVAVVEALENEPEAASVREVTVTLGESPVEGKAAIPLTVVQEA